MPIQNEASYKTDLSGETKNGNAKYAISNAADDIRKDLSSLQTDVSILASDVKKAGSDKARAAMSYVNDQVDSLKSTGTGAIGKIEDGIKSNPGQSVTIAFAAGLLLSFLLGRRS
jgi:ElaB/YqjD/DUF883 family membrane-anchored ribosome-binding protein